MTNDIAVLLFVVVKVVGGVTVQVGETRCMMCRWSARRGRMGVLREVSRLMAVSTQWFAVHSARYISPIPLLNAWMLDVSEAFLSCFVAIQDITYNNSRRHFACGLETKHTNRPVSVTTYKCST